MEIAPRVHRHRQRRQEARHRSRHERNASNTSDKTNESASPKHQQYQLDDEEENSQKPQTSKRHRQNQRQHQTEQNSPRPHHRRHQLEHKEPQPQSQRQSQSVEQASSDILEAAEEGLIPGEASELTVTTITAISEGGDAAAAATTTILLEENERSKFSFDSSGDLQMNSSGNSQQTVVLVNGQAPPQEHQNTFDSNQSEYELQLDQALAPNDDPNLEQTNVNDMANEASEMNELNTTTTNNKLESPTQQQTSNISSRNSSGDAMSLRETLQQLPANITNMHRHRRSHSPQSPQSRALEADSSFHRGILGIIDRDYKQSSSPILTAKTSSNSSTLNVNNSRKLQSLSDPQASPAQRSLRSRSSLDKSPRRKRSKSESRRRRERKLIAAGEMEVRQANETLMRYLKQCSEMNDASLSGELEIDQSYDERKVHRKTKSQRDKRGHLLSKLYTAGGLSSILKELSDDIIPAEGEEIYNPFTPVVSPTDDTPAHIDKMFLQTSSGYRPVEHCYYKHSFLRTYRARSNGTLRGLPNDNANDNAGTCNGVGLNDATSPGSMGLRTCGSYGDTRCLLDAADFTNNEISSKIEMSCFFQRFWILISNICHGLLAGLALAHLLFVLSSHPMDWTRLLNAASDASSQEASHEPTTADALSSMTTNDNDDFLPKSIKDSSNGLVAEYATFAEIYLNTFFCLTIICLVSVFDRMDICRLDLSNATELISFRWVIIAMIYIATIILTICSDSIDEKLYLLTKNTNLTLSQDEMLNNNIRSVWSSLSITRSIGALCGWIMIGLTPHDDLLYEHLLDLTKYQLPNQ